MVLFSGTVDRLYRIWSAVHDTMMPGRRSTPSQETKDGCTGEMARGETLERHNSESMPWVRRSVISIPDRCQRLSQIWGSVAEGWTATKLDIERRSCEGDKVGPTLAGRRRTPHVSGQNRASSWLHQEPSPWSVSRWDVRSVLLQ
jgi:hypothetical protein